MAIKPIDLEMFIQRAKNIHEGIVAMSKRARQINEEMKIEFNQRVELVTVKPEVESEEVDINPDQLNISLEFEKRPKPTDVAVEELMAAKLQWRYKQTESPVQPEVKEEEIEEEE